MEIQQKKDEIPQIPLEEEKIMSLIHIIRQYSKYENILEKIDPRLKVLYDNRVINYDKKFELENSWGKI